jgi:Protein of unknown function (DUF559)
VLDLWETLGGDAIDHVLRTRAATLEQLHRALELTPARAGNRLKRQLLLDSRSERWSAAERSLHRLLRAAGITGWKANRPVIPRDLTFYVDVIFRKLKLVIEIDGRLYHTGAEVFETDRWRQNLKFDCSARLRSLRGIHGSCQNGLGPRPAPAPTRSPGRSSSSSSLPAANWEL